MDLKFFIILPLYHLGHKDSFQFIRKLSVKIDQAMVEDRFSLWNWLHLFCWGNFLPWIAWLWITGNTHGAASHLLSPLYTQQKTQVVTEHSGFARNNQWWEALYSQSWLTSEMKPCKKLSPESGPQTTFLQRSEVFEKQKEPKGR